MPSPFSCFASSRRASPALGWRALLRLALLRLGLALLLRLVASARPCLAFAPTFALLLPRLALLMFRLVLLSCFFALCLDSVFALPRFRFCFCFCFAFPFARAWACSRYLARFCLASIICRLAFGPPCLASGPPCPLRRQRFLGERGRILTGA